MTDTAGNRRARRSRQGRGVVKKRTKTLAAAAALATAMTVGVAAAPAPLPAARADIDIPLITQDPVFTTGLLAGLIAGLGIDKVSIPLNLSIDTGIGIIGKINIGTLDLVLDNVPRGTQNLYNSINGWAGWSTSGNTRSRFPATLGIGNGAFYTVNAYRAQRDSVMNGNTPPGYTPFVPGPNGQTNFTSQELLLLNDPYRPNGGILTRFGPLLNLFGVDTTLPPVGTVTDTSGKIKLNTGMVDLALAYSPMADFPATLNPFSLLNSAFAALPTNVLGGVNLDSNFNAGDAGLNIAGVLGIITKLTGGLYAVPDGQAFYGTLIPNDLPLLEPLRLPSRIISLVSGALGNQIDLPTPLADALQPALTILVNTGYTDVQTPTEGGTYNRLFNTSSQTIPFLSRAPLTPQEWAHVPGDVIRALIVGFQDSFPILRFGKTAPELAVDGNHLKIVYPPAGSGAPVAPTTATTEVTSTPTANSVVTLTTSTNDPVTTSPTSSSLRTTGKKRSAAPAAVAVPASGSQDSARNSDSASAHKSAAGQQNSSDRASARHARAAG